MSHRHSHSDSYPRPTRIRVSCVVLRSVMMRPRIPMHGRIVTDSNATHEKRIRVRRTLEYIPKMYLEMKTQSLRCVLKKLYIYITALEPGCAEHKNNACVGCFSQVASQTR